MREIENDTPIKLDQIVMLRRKGVSEQDVGKQIVECLRNTSTRLNQITSHGYQQIENSNQTVYNREQTLNYWRGVCNNALNSLKGFIGTYYEHKLYDLGSNIVQEIPIGSLNFRAEIEGYLANDESTFARLGENLKTMLNQVTVKLQENDGGSNKIEELLLGLMNQNKIMEQENREINNRIVTLRGNI